MWVYAIRSDVWPFLTVILLQYSWTCLLIESSVTPFSFTSSDLLQWCSLRSSAPVHSCHMASPFPFETESLPRYPPCWFSAFLQHSSLTEITAILVRVDNEERYLLQKVACKKTNLIAAYTALVKELASDSHLLDHVRMNVAMVKPKTENSDLAGEGYWEIYSALRHMAGGDRHLCSSKKMPWICLFACRIWQPSLALCEKLPGCLHQTSSDLY